MPLQWMYIGRFIFLFLRDVFYGLPFDEENIERILTDSHWTIFKNNIDEDIQAVNDRDNHPFYQSFRMFHIVLHLVLRFVLHFVFHFVLRFVFQFDL